jgi:DNA-binding transcriptional regulator YhcF (GntR family)
VKKVYQEVSEEVLGYKRKGKKDWISEDTWKIIQKRKDSKAKVNKSKTRKRKMEAQEEYNVLNVEVKRATRRDKRKWIDEMASIV